MFESLYAARSMEPAKNCQQTRKAGVCDNQGEWLRCDGKDGGRRLGKDWQDILGFTLRTPIAIQILFVCLSLSREEK